MSPLDAIAGGLGLAGWIALAIALLDRSRLVARVGALETAAAQGQAAAQAARADVAERQIAAAQAGRKDAEDALDTTIATIGDGVMAPDVWDHHAGVPAPKPAAGDDPGPVTVPDR